MTARTIMRSQVLMIPGETFRQAVREDPALSFAVAEELSGCYSGVVRVLKNYKLRGALERLANYLLVQQRRQGGGATLRLPCQKRVLASLLGMTPENLSRAFATLGGHGVQVDGANVTIHRPGALARLAVAQHPLAVALLAKDGASSVRSRVVARLLETAILVHSMQGWLRQLKLKEEFCSHFALPDDATSFGLVEAARGALGHWVSLRGGRISRYQIIAPTTWNFSPRDAAGVPGPLESALVGLDTGGLGAKSAALQHVIRSFDPCMVCTAH